MKISKIKKILKACLPDMTDLTLLFRGLVLVAIFATFGYLFYYSSSSATAQALTETGAVVDTAAIPAVWRSLECTANGAVCTSKNGGTQGSNMAVTISGAPYDEGINLASALKAQSGGVAQVNYGATGMIINSTSGLYQTQVASPSYMPQHYANRAMGKVYAASDPTAGESVLQPIYFLSSAMRNLAYGIIVILLVVSSFSILLGYLTGAEQKITLVQVMLNTFMTLLLITFFYQISAIIYDLTVNYGNMLVSSIMEPFINAKVILERLGPGGDLNVTALTNVFEFVGIGGALNTIAGNVMLGARPAITQSLYGVNNAVTGGFGTAGAVFGYMNSFATGTVGVGLNSVLSGLLGSQALFDAMIAWVIFFVNIKIFGNLLYSFISFNIYVGFGPLLMLQSVNQGFGKTKDIFKTLALYGLTFPVTFLFILLGATAMNFYYKSPTDNATIGNTSDREKTVLCYFQTNDPTAAENNLTSHIGIKGANDSPLSFRRENTEYQNIFDTTSAPTKDPSKRSCRSSLFALPFTFFPAPLGNYGNRLIQVQTTDIIVRTVMAIMFLVIASRVPKILHELMQVEEMKSLQGLGGSIKAGLQPVLALGGVGMGIATGLTFKGMGAAGKFAGNRSIPFLSKSSRVGSMILKSQNWYANRVDRNLNKPKNMSFNDIVSGYSAQANAKKGVRKAGETEERFGQAVLASDRFNKYRINPASQKPEFVPDGDERADPKSANYWQPFKPKRFDPNTGEELTGDDYANVAMMDPNISMAARNLGKQYADPVIGASMQGWIQAMSGVQQVTAGLSTSFGALQQAVELVTKNIANLSKEILAENFE